jgi:hypothetical protein
MLADLGRRSPLQPGADVLAVLDVDSQQKRVYGHAKQGAAFGHTKIQGKRLLVHGLNVLAATFCTPLAAPVIAATRLRGGNAASARGAGSLITEAVTTSRATGCTGALVGPEGLSVLRRPSLLGRPQSRCASLRHRPRGSQGPRRDPCYPRRRLDTDPPPPRAIWDVIEALAAPVRAGRRSESRQIRSAHPGEDPVMMPLLIPPPRSRQPGDDDDYP